MGRDARNKLSQGLVVLERLRHTLSIYGAHRSSYRQTTQAKGKKERKQARRRDSPNPGDSPILLPMPSSLAVANRKVGAAK